MWNVDFGLYAAFEPFFISLVRSDFVCFNPLYYLVNDVSYIALFQSVLNDTAL